MPLEAYVVGAEYPIRTTYEVDETATVPDTLTLVVVSPSGTRTTKSIGSGLSLTGTSTYSYLAPLTEAGTWRWSWTAVKSGLETEMSTGAVYARAAP